MSADASLSLSSLASLSISLLIETIAFINRQDSVTTLHTFRFSFGFSYPHYETRTDSFFFSFFFVAFFFLSLQNVAF